MSSSPLATITGRNMDKKCCKLFPSSTIRQNEKLLSTIPLLPLNCSFGIVTSNQEHIRLQELAIGQAKAKKCAATVVFVVRHPGCPLCREHALQLTELASVEDIALVGVVKERGVNDKALLEFYTRYFKFPIFQDEHWKIYKSMGGRTLCAFGAVKAFISAKFRLSAKKIETEMKCGEAWIQGGLLIYDRRGRLRYSYDEEAGVELDLEAVRTAIQEIRRIRPKIKDVETASLPSLSTSSISDTSSSSLTEK
jgi:hypothetical protein